MRASPSLAVAGAGLALAAPGKFSTGLLNKRTGYDLCETDCKLAGAAFPDKHTLQLMLENNWSEQCPPIYIGADPNAPTATSKVCLDVVGTDIVFNFASFPGYTYQNAAVTWKLMGNLLKPESWNAPPPAAAEISCSPSLTGDGLACKLPFSDILGVSSSTSAKDLLSGMCPNGDREGLGLYLSFAGQVQSTEDSSVTSFAQSPPCTARDSTGKCIACASSSAYIEVAYRCSTCTSAPACPSTTSTTRTRSCGHRTSTTTSSVTSTTATSAETTSSDSTTTPPTSTATSCSFGTAFGYQSPEKSTTLDTQSGEGCKRWGWYQTPTLAELQSGISGPLYVGAGNNDISKATDVGVWTATANAQGRVTVTYLLNPPYTLSEVHVDLECLPIEKCAPGSYTVGESGLGDVPARQVAVGSFPSCSGGSKAALIVHAAVDQMVRGGTACPAKKAE
ncbi:hypothetical protein C8A03DRAFT_16338 [Achaetomium macrosporum]|uniref:Uncharacterized protein n=1 Tax=Achaetomium macrosporum TaxID=79813 RepID=A0AAN7H6B4_9PEZI|nr:hypothetical protein C8A03DRAFT_16338 [Achaetomium macrosporum]